MKKLVVITGASSGIGESVAKRMSQAGHPVLLLARRSQITEGFHLPDIRSYYWLAAVRLPKGFICRTACAAVWM